MLQPQREKGEVNVAQNDKQELTAPEQSVRRLTLSETDDCLDFYMFHAFRVAMGTMFCIVSPVVAVLIDGFNTADLIPQDAAELLESMSIIIFVAIAACMFIYSGIRIEKWSYIHEEACVLDPKAARFVRREKSGYWPLHMRITAAGIALCVAGFVLGYFISRMGEEFPYAYNLAAAILLILVSIGVFLILMSFLRMHYYNMFLGLKGKQPKKKEEQTEEGNTKYKNAIVRKGMSVFWPTVAAFYLSLSFLTFAWGISWIIWPLAALAAAIINFIFKER